MTTILATSGESIPLYLLLEDGATGFFPRARIYDETSALVTTVDLTHIAGGLYYVLYTVPTAEKFQVIYTVYTDVGRTLEALDREKAEDTIIADNASTAGAVADAVWDELRLGHGTAGSFGEALQTVVGTRAAPGDAMTLTGPERLAVGIAVRDTSITSSVVGSLGEALQIVLGVSGKTNYRIDNMIYDGNGFLTTARVRVFPSQLLAIASTSGGTGQGEIATITLSGVPHGTFLTAPIDVLGLKP